MQYSSQGKRFICGLPFGNGRIAAAVWGDDSADVLTLNHERLWTGLHGNKRTYKAARYLPQLRELIQSGDTFAATAFGNLFWGGKGGVSGVPNEMNDYVPAGELCIRFSDTTEFLSRRLDSERGVAYTERAVSGGKAVSRYYADCNFGGYVFTVNADKPVSVKLSYSREPDPRLECGGAEYTADGIKYSARYAGGTAFCVSFRVETDGSVKVGESGLTVEKATKILICGDCTVGGGSGARHLSCDEAAFAAHTEKFSRLMNEVVLDLGEVGSDALGMKNESVAAGKPSAALIKLYFDYGRYLFLSGSVCAEMPLNLQGKWNAEIKPPWSSDYHLNINLQMNYWAAEKIGFSDFLLPLENYLMKLAENGKRTAKDMYGCRGFVFSHSSDECAHAVPQAYGWAVWVSAAGWLGTHLWSHYLYTRDKDFLERVYPYLKGVAEFYEDFLTPDENGILQIMPSQSPENRYGDLGRFPVALCRSSAMDVQICYESLSIAVSASELLKKDASSREKWQSAIQKLPPFRTGADGRLLEWESAQSETEKGHRHLSHLYGAYPGNLFSREERSEKFDAALKSLDYRIEHGGGQTGWSAAWAAALYARAGREKEFAEILKRLILDCTTDTLLDLHPPEIFQIDGNLGGVDAIVEALVSVHGNAVYLGNAAGALSGGGSVRGIRIPKGHKVSYSWSGGEIHDAFIEFAESDEVVFATQKNRVTVCGGRGEKKIIPIR